MAVRGRARQTIQKTLHLGMISGAVQLSNRANGPSQHAREQRAVARRHMSTVPARDGERQPSARRPYGEVGRTSHWSALVTAGNRADVRGRRDTWVSCSRASDIDALGHLHVSGSASAFPLGRKIEKGRIDSDAPRCRSTEVQSHQYQCPHTFAPVRLQHRSLFEGKPWGI
jgi:hypothetical protein